MLGGAALAPISLMGFSLVTGTLADTQGAFLLSCLFAAIAAAFSSVFLVSSMTILQLKVPDGLRGRVMGIHSVTFSLIALGGLIAGVLAASYSAPIALVIGAGIVLMSVIWVSYRSPHILFLDGTKLES